MAKENIKNMVSSIVDGDLTKAGDDFEAALQMKRQAEWDNAKLTLARTAFDEITPEVTHEPVDTGITGEPEEEK